jgi:acetyl esterase/lipase
MPATMPSVMSLVRCAPRVAPRAAAALYLAWAGQTAAQPVPTWNDVPIAAVPLDAGGTKTLLMDIFAPIGTFAGPRPVALFVHGGGWAGGDHNNAGGIFQPLRQQGFVVATCTYRLSGQAIFPAQIHDVKGAIRYLRANAGLYNIDPTRVAIGGTSAGGHLAALAGTSADEPALEGTTGGNPEWSSRLQAVVDFFGPTDIILMNPDVTDPPGSVIDHDSSGSPESRLIGFAQAGEGIGVLRANLNNPLPPFPQKAGLAASVNPITHVSGDDPPFFIAHGDQDTSVPTGQSVRLDNALRDADLRSTFTIAPGYGHGYLGASIETLARAFVITELSRCPADLNADGASDLSDFFAFLNWFDQDDPRANLNLRDGVDLADFFGFLTAFDQGC